VTVRIAINGFGRIGRQVLRHVTRSDADIDVVVVNSQGAQPELCAHQLKYDSVFGRYPGEIDHDDEYVHVGPRAIRIIDQPAPHLCPWSALDIDVVVEATGKFTTRDSAGFHLRAGARKVLITAPALAEDLTLVIGANENLYDPDRHHVVSAGSSTTNCLAPMLTVLHEAFGLEGAFVTSIHALTRDQQLLDGTHHDLRRARAATLNMTPTKTGAAKAIDRVLPHLVGRVVGIAVRVPVPDVSLVDLSVILTRPTTADEINDVFWAAAAGSLARILGVTDEPLVSADFRGDTRSAVIDLASTRRGPGTQAKVLGWYDNEAGYAARVVDLCQLLGRSTGTFDPIGRGRSGVPQSWMATVSCRRRFWQPRRRPRCEADRARACPTGRFLGAELHVTRTGQSSSARGNDRWARGGRQ
jgi:glyceraldehyde 3-phosphate dehydrogenase